jgi:hypothetical protein
MSATLNNVLTQDTYADATTLACAGTQRLNLDVAQAAVYFQLGYGIGAATWDASEVYLGPSFRSLDPIPGQAFVCDWVRVRSAQRGLPARVTIHAR